MINYDYLRIELQRVFEEARIERLQAVIKTEKMISELQREDRLKEQQEKDFKLMDKQAKVFDRIFGIRY